MSAYEAVVRWETGDDASFLSRRYSRAHLWRFDGGAEVPASASPHVVPEPLSDPAGVDPEEALVAALASCHMLFFLDLASRNRLAVRSYVDRATGRMGKRPDGRDAMVEVVLRPEVELATPTGSELVAGLHERAHTLCYIANSVNFPVRVEPIV